jgi:CRISPR-associated endoribonuclease Cas6
MKIYQQIFFRPINGDKLILPIQYNHIIQGMIYESLSEDIAEFLHEKGFTKENRSFKMFSFSRLLGNYIIDKIKGTITFRDTISLVITSPYDSFCNSLMTNLLLKKSVRIGNTNHEVIETKLEKKIVEGDCITIKTLSPIVAYSTFLRPDGRKYTCYFQPGEADYSTLIFNNLKNKYKAFYNEDAPRGSFQIKCLHQPKMSVMNYKQTIIKGYSGDFLLSGPISLLQIAVDSGLGSKNSQGFGCVELIKKA